MKLRQLTEVQQANLLQLKNNMESIFLEIEKTETDIERLVKREKGVVGELEKLDSVAESTRSNVEAMLRRERAALSELEDMHKRVHKMANLYYVMHEELLSVIDPMEEEEEHSNRDTLDLTKK